MSAKDKNTEIADQIIGILRGELKISSDTQHYIDSTFANPGIEELEEQLQDESSCETDSLMELLFFPDEAVQLQLESLLEDAQLQPHDEESIRERVCGRALQSCFCFPDGRGTLKMTVSPTNAASFVERLNLSRNPDPKLRAAIAGNVNPVLQTRCKVRLRNARPVDTAEKISFLQSFFEKIKIDENDFFDYLDFTIGFVGELKEDADIFSTLMAYKKIYFQGLQKTAKLEKQLAKHNVETLLLSGVRFVDMDRADARRKIQMIDRISLAVFGKTDFFDLMPAEGQSITMDGLDDIDKLIKEFN